MICTLKQGLSLSLIQRLLPCPLPEEEVQHIYAAYVERHRIAASYFTDQVRLAAAPILDHDGAAEISTPRPEDLIAAAAVVGGFSRLLAEKLLLLEGKTLETGGDTSIITEIQE